MISNQPSLKYNPGSPSVYTRHMPFHTYSENLLKDLSRVRDPLTIYNDREELRKFAYPVIGNLPVCDVSAQHVRQIKKEVFSHNFNPQYTNRIECVIRRPFKHAVAHRILERNPFDHVWSILQISKGTASCYSYEELLQIMRVVEACPLRNMYYTAIFTGMTSGELAGLTWDNIDFLGNRLTINKILKKSSTMSELYYETYRFHGFNRVLDVDPYVMDNFLLDQFHHTHAYTPQSNVVFTRPGGLPFTIGNYATWIKKEINQKTSNTPISLRKIRSTFGIYECLCGENLALLRHQLGIKNSGSVLAYHFKATNIKPCVTK